MLLRIEASDDKEGDSNLASAGAGQGVVNTGAVAGFPLPTIRARRRRRAHHDLDGGAPGDLRLLAPVDEAVVLSGDLDLAWLELPQADVYRVEMADQAGQVLLSALVQRGVSAYRAPPFLKERAPGGQVRWRVVAIDVTGRELRSSVWRRLRVE